MKKFALVFTLFFGIAITNVQAQEPPCCSPEWCAIFCGENQKCDLKKCDTKAIGVANVDAKSCKPVNCKPADCKKVAKSCGPASDNAKAVAKTVANKSEEKQACCVLPIGCCASKKASTQTSCSKAEPVKAKKVAMN